MAFFYGIWEQLTFGKYLIVLMDFVRNNAQVLAFIIFIYVVIIFLGRYGGAKYIPNRFEDYVLYKSKELLQDDTKKDPKEIIDTIYSGWKGEIKNFPNYIFIKSKKDYWIEKPNLENIEERLNINKNTIKEVLISNGVISND
ncbi:MAG: hypothetical protein ACOWWR_20260 [Eubacteriales bacterium]